MMRVRVLGPVLLGETEEPGALGPQFGEQRNYSEARARAIDAEVKRLVDTGHERATQLLQTNLDLLHALAHKLEEVETISGEELHEILGKVRRFEPRANGRAQLPAPGTAVLVAADTSAARL